MSRFQTDTGAKGDAFKFCPWKEADVLWGGEHAGSRGRRLTHTQRAFIITVGLKALKISFQKYLLILHEG